MERLLSDLKKHKKNPPKVIHNKNDHCISVKHNFNHGYITKVWLRAHRDVWLDWFYRPDQFTFETVEDYLSRTPRDTKDKLIQYALEYPQDFDSDIRFCVNYTLDHIKHPGSDKPRGGQPYGLSPKEMDEIEHTARHLYIYLKNNLKKSDDELPQGLKKLLKLHGIKPDKKKVREITMQIIEQIFNFKMDIKKESIENGVDPIDSFYKKYIVHRSLKSISNSKRINSFVGDPNLLKVLIVSCIRYL